MIKVYAYPADYAGCGHYRVIWPGLAAGGPDVEVVVPDRDDTTTPDVEAHLRDDGSVWALNAPDDADVVVIQRPASRVLPETIRMLRARGIAVVVDIDDAMDRIHPSNPAWAGMHPNAVVRTPGGLARRELSWAVARDACAAATLVTVSTPALKRLYAPGTAVVLPNFVPAAFCDAPRVDSDVVAWCGSLHSHPGDLDVLGGAVAQFVRGGGRFGVVGPGDGVAELLGTPGPVAATGLVPFDVWPDAVADVGVAVAPLADTSFNAAKSWLKGLEAMACGVPVIMSPRAEYARLVREAGVGFLAAKPRQWLALMRRLAGDGVLRAEQSEAGRVVVRERFTVEGNAWRWAEVWADAARLERRAVVV